MIKNEAGAGVGSSATANQILKSIKPYYQKGSESDKKAILERLNKLKIEPGVSIPLNAEALLSN